MNPRSRTSLRSLVHPLTSAVALVGILLMMISTAMASEAIRIDGITFTDGAATLDLGDAWEIDVAKDQKHRAVKAAECIGDGGQAWAIVSVGPDGEMSVGIVNDCDR